MKKSVENWAGLRTHVIDASGGNKPTRVYVLFHGFGAPGTDLVDLHQVLYGQNDSVFVFPEAPLSLGRVFGPVESRAWWMIDLERFEKAGSDPEALDALINDCPDGVAELREQMKTFFQTQQARFGNGWDETIVGGFSQGSMLALDLAVMLEGAPKAVLLLSSSMMDAGHWRKNINKLNGVPVFQSHGRQDPILPFSVAEQLKNELQKAGAKVEWQPFDGEHTIPMEVLQELHRFLQRIDA